jgi:hypothetical protein
MNWKFKALWVVAPFWIASLPCQAGPAEIRVRLQVYSPISPSTLREAKETASGALRQAGIRVSWAECPASIGKLPDDPACRLAFTPLDLQIRLIDEVMAKRVRRRSTCMGFAVVAGEFNSIAAAYVHRARELAGNNLANQGEILGGIIAHEIGHLLEVTTHSENGLMRGIWEDESLKVLAKGRLWFTEAQARRMAAAISKRAAALSAMAATGLPQTAVVTP